MSRRRGSSPAAVWHQHACRRRQPRHMRRLAGRVRPGLLSACTGGPRYGLARVSSAHSRVRRSSGGHHPAAIAVEAAAAAAACDMHVHVQALRSVAFPYPHPPPVLWEGQEHIKQRTLASSTRCRLFKRAARRADAPEGGLTRPQVFTEARSSGEQRPGAVPASPGCWSRHSVLSAPNSRTGATARLDG